MSNKVFLALFLVAYTIPAVVVNVTLGPPGMSAEYLEAGNNKAAHDRYLEITKRTSYKKYAQRPEAQDLDDRAAADFAFVAEYESREAFQHEMERRHKYDLFFEFWNFLAVVVLAVYYGRKPFLNFVDGQVAQVRERLEGARARREGAEARKAEVEAKLRNLPEERASLLRQADELKAADLSTLHEQTEGILKQIDTELEDRKRMERWRAAMQIKREIVDEVFARVEADLQANDSDELQRAMIAQFHDSAEAARP